MDYRAWLQSDPSKAWALNYVGNDYNSDNYGIDQTKLSSNLLQDDYGRALTQLKTYAQEYGGSQGLFGASTSTPNSTGSSGTGQTYNPQQVALYDQAIGNVQSGIDRLDFQKGTAQNEVNTGATNSLNRLLSAKQTVERDYNTNKDQSTRENVSARSTVDYNTGRQANALQRLLGSRGAGRSSASRTAAPYAAALQGTQQRRGVADAYGQNVQALDTAFGDYNNGYEAKVKNVGDMKGKALRDVEVDTLTKRNDLLSQLANNLSAKALYMGQDGAAAARPYLDQINANNGSIDNLNRQYSDVVEAKDPTYKAPDLAKYNTDRPSAAVLNGNAATSSINPSYLSVLLGKKKEQQLSF